ncbi:hypothetical protein DFH06DRAFT_977764, partial [Mycena polygramma]
LARRAGVKRIHRAIYDETRGTLTLFLEDLIRQSVLYCEHSKRKRATALDVAYAVKRTGRMLYGFGV